MILNTKPMKQMMRITLYTFVLILTASSLFWACNESDASFSEQIKMVPADAAVVVNVDFDRLESKLSLEQIQNSSLFDLLADKGDTSLFRVICAETERSGVNPSELVMFITVEKQLGLALALSDASAFEDWVVSSMADEGVYLDAIENTNFKSCLMKDAGTDALLMWDDSKALLMTDVANEEDALIFNQDVSESIISNSEFATFYADRHELALWMDMESYFNLVGNTNKFRSMGFPMLDEYKDLYKGMYTYYNVEFQDGALCASGKVVPLDKAKKISAMYYKEKQSKDLLSAVPANSYLLMSAAMKMSEFMEVYEGIPQFKELLEDPETAKIVESIDGDFILSLCDFAPGPLPIPNAVIGLSVNDESLLETIKDVDGIQKVDKDGYTALLVQLFQVYVAQKNDILLLSTNEDVIKSFAAGDPLEGNLLDSQHTDDVESTAYYYMNLNLDSYPDAIKGLLKGKMGEGYTTLSQSMRFEDLVSSYEYSTCEYEVTLNMKDKDTNSLSALFDMVDVVFSMQ